MKTEEVLFRLNISRPTLKKYIELGKIKGIRQFNGRYVFNDDEIIKLSDELNNQTKPNTMSNLFTEPEKVEETNESPEQKADYSEEIKKVVEANDKDLIILLENSIKIFDSFNALRLLSKDSIQALNNMKELLQTKRSK